MFLKMLIARFTMLYNILYNNNTNNYGYRDPQIQINRNSQLKMSDNLLGFKLGDGLFAANNFKDAFNFFTTGEPEGRRIIDFDDIEGFAKRMAASQGVSIEAAYGMVQTAYQQALAAQVPEPRSIVMVILAATTLGLSRRRG